MHFLVWLVVGWRGCVCGYKSLEADRIRSLVTEYPPTKYLTIDDTEGFLEPILKVRIPGTQGSKDVQEHFFTFFSTLHSDWKIERDQFYDDTPVKENVSFTNVIATRDPPDSDPRTIRRLTLAAHYDSKIDPKGFIGAIDSAVPCALIMHAVNSIDNLLTDKWNNSKQESLGLQVIFFDGEEAFQRWSDTDSIYGARHLAKKMAHTPRWPGHSKESQLASIETLVLLDLIGAAKTKIFSFFANTHWMFNKLRVIESRLKQMDMSKTEYSIFQEKDAFISGGNMGDDHLPFLYSGVPILHLIPIDFPPVWHTKYDDAAHLDAKSINDWAQILSVFLAEYFELSSSSRTKHEL